MLSSSCRMASTVVENLALISGRVAQAYQGAGNSKAAQSPRLVAVSKTKPKEAILEAYRAGHRVFGENYVKELEEKSNDPELQAECPDIQWHFIGSCQNNKAKVLMNCPRLSMVETVTSTKLAGKLNNQAKSPVGVLVQVNTSGEANKNGLEPKEVITMVRFLQESCPNLVFRGLMTIGDLGNSEAASSTGENPDFQVLLETRKAVAAELGEEESGFELSMGMSKDYEEAIRMGSTNVRVGSSIFGARSYPAAPKTVTEGVATVASGVDDAVATVASGVDDSVDTVASGLDKLAV